MAPSVLTPAALRELDQLLVGSRRQLAAIYRDQKAGAELQDIALELGHDDLKKVKESMAALRILFGRETLPKQGKGRQQALYEAHYWLHSDDFLSDELQAHFEKLLLKGDKTNVRRGDYEPLLPPSHRTVYQEARAATKEGDYKGIYVLARSSVVELHEVTGKPMLVKVGWSHNVWDRVANAQTWDPDRLQVLRIYPCANPNIIERKLHIALDTLGCAYEGDGGREWFTIQSLELIDSMAKELGLAPAET